MKRFYLYGVLLLLSSCQEEVVLELKSQEPTPIIEGIWTDAGTINHVNVSWSRDYYSQEPNAPVEDAEVFIVSPTNRERVNFKYSEKSQRYLPDDVLGGKIGDIYELNVKIGENRYVSRGEMLAPPRLDSITYSYKEGRAFRDDGYFLTLYGDIPFTEDNNYRVRIVRNDTLLNRRSDYLLFDDTFGTTILTKGFELSGFAFEDKDKVRLELYRLNQDAYDYMSQLVNLLFNDGGLFSPPPENPKTNIEVVAGEGEVLGYFLVSPILTQTIRINPE